MAHDDPDYGVLDRTGERPVLRLTMRLAHPPQKVWPVLTEEPHLSAWFPTTMEGSRSAGSPLRFGFRELDVPPMDGEMLAFEPPTLMELRWGEDILRFELEEDGAGSLLRLAVTFESIGKVARDAAGWHVCLEQLGFADDGTELPWEHAARWKVVHPGYVERFGPEASTEGPPEEWERVHGDGAAGRTTSA